MNYYAQSRPHN